eukprot:424308_1
MSLSATLFDYCLIINIINGAQSPLSTWTIVNETLPIEFINGGLLSGYDPNQNKIWLIGPYEDNKVWSYSLSTNNFSIESSLPFTLQMNAQSYTQMNRVIYFTHNNQLRDYEMCCGYLGSLTVDMKYPRDSPCMVNDGYYLFLIGGSSGTLAAIQFQIYNLSSNLWIDGTSLYIAKARASCAISPYGNYIYLFGGTHNGNDPTTHNNSDISIHKTYIGDKTNFTYPWIQLNVELLTNVYFARAVTVGDFIYLIGGRDLYDNVDAQVTLFDPSNDTLQITTSLERDRSSPSAIVVNGRIYVFGYHDHIFEYSNVLTSAPTNSPTELPTFIPTFIPTIHPTFVPTFIPTIYPTIVPTFIPTIYPTIVPTFNSTIIPTVIPSISPLMNPSVTPTSNPVKSGAVPETTQYLGTMGNYDLNTDVMSIQTILFIFIGVIIGLIIVIVILCLIWRHKKNNGIETNFMSDVNTIELGVENQNVNSQSEANKVDQNIVNDTDLDDNSIYPTVPNNDTDKSDDGLYETNHNIITTKGDCDNQLSENNQNKDNVDVDDDHEELYIVTNDETANTTPMPTEGGI